MQPDYDEEELVRAARLGDRDAFACLYEANVVRVYRYVLARLGRPYDAEDVTAQVFVRAMKALSSYEPRGIPLIAWLSRIAHNETVNYVKKRARHRRRESALDHAIPSHHRPEDETVTHLSASEVWQATSRLTELQRQVLNLRFGSELSVAETARAMGRTEGAVKFLQYSAIRAMQRVLGQDGTGGHAEQA